MRGSVNVVKTQLIQQMSRAYDLILRKVRGLSQLFVSDFLSLQSLETTVHDTPSSCPYSRSLNSYHLRLLLPFLPQIPR